MGRVRATDGFRRRLRKPEITYLAGLDEVRHRADGLLDRHGAIYAMLIIEIDLFDTEALERGVASRPYVFGPAVDLSSTVGMADDSEFGRDDHAIPNRPELAPDQFLIVIRPIHVRGVEKIDSQFERTMQRRNRFGIVARSVEFRHAHASEAKFGNY